MDEKTLTIWKFPLPIVGEQRVKLPEGAKPLYIGTQGGATQLWALVDPRARREERVIHCYGTGHDMPLASKKWKHLGTVQLPGGLVFHFFEGQS